MFQFHIESPKEKWIRFTVLQNYFVQNIELNKTTNNCGPIEYMDNYMKI